MLKTNTKQALACKKWLIIAAIMCLLSVVMGAFAAHALKAILSSYELDIVQTAARYQMYHGLAILLVTALTISNALHQYLTNRRLIVINTCFVLGICLFSGSLYALAFTHYKYFAFLTPIGGVLFLTGWFALIYFLLRPALVATHN